MRMEAYDSWEPGDAERLAWLEAALNGRFVCKVHYRTEQPRPGVRPLDSAENAVDNRLAARPLRLK